MITNKLIPYIVVILLSFIDNAQSNENKTVIKNSEQQSFITIINILNDVAQTGTFATLKMKLDHKDGMNWGQCNTENGLTVSIDEIVNELNLGSKGIKIAVNNKSTGGLIETEGWFGEYPYYYFYFAENKGTWKWLGVCYDFQRSLDFAIARGGKDKLYDSPPTLPRTGPRVFQDNIALRARIEEIILFKAFDALELYAVKKNVAVSQCNREMMEKDAVVGKKVPVLEAIRYLKDHAPERGTITTSSVSHKAYFETAGWRGDYPVIAFWFSEGQNGWEWAGISYCKTDHFDLLTKDSKGFSFFK